MNRFAMNKYVYVALLVSLCLGLGCPLPNPRPVVQEELNKVDPRAVMEEQKKIKHPGPAPFKEMLSPVTEKIPEDTKLYSLSFNNVPFGEVVTALTASMKTNLSVESEVDLARPVTVNLKNVTFREALDMLVVRGAGYTWTIEKSCLYIKRFEQRIYHLDYLDLLGSTNIEVGGDMLSSSVEGSGVVAKYQVKSKSEDKASDVWASVRRVLEGIKSPEGSVRINRKAGIIYLEDTPKRIATMVGFLDAISESLHRQVFIEARIMEVRLSDTYNLGIDWAELDVAFTSGSGGLPDVFSLGLNSGTLMLAEQSRLVALVDFLETQGDVTILSNPHLSILNGQSAVMTVGKQFPYADIEGVDRDTETNTITYGVAIRRAVIGLQLGITPQISRDGMISLHIVPAITRIQEEQDIIVPLGGDEEQTISNPIIDLQELATTVRVREGDSVVLAGLISQIRNLDHEGLPWLSKIPYFGNFFKKIEQTEENRELVIVITPYVMESS